MRALAVPLHLIYPMAMLILVVSVHNHRRQPYAGMPLLQVAFGVTIEGLRLTIPDSCPGVFRQLMEKCWETDPEGAY